MAVNIAAVAAVILYCIAVMSVGVWSGRKLHGDIGYTSATDDRKQSFHRGSRAASSNFLLKLFLAEGRLPVLLGIFSMTATWVGGGYLNGTAEAVYSSGIVYCFAPVGYAVSLVLGGSFFAKKMRKAHAITMLDPMQQHYGRWMGLLLCLPAVCGEVFWTAAMLAALGDTAGAIMQVNSALFVVILASIILFYTSLGGYYSVSYTDVLQITSTAVFLWICIPYAAESRVINTLLPPHNDWVGGIASRDITRIVDGFLVTALGGIPWQVYFQRVLGSDSDYTAKMLSYVAAIGCLFLAMPPAILGAMAKTANFTAAGYPGPAILRDRDRARVLPFSIRYLTSPTLSVLGMIGILAAVMSSVDSSMLSASTMVTWNVYHALIRPKASDREVALMLRVMVCAIGASATYLALSVQSVFNLWILCSDVVYVLLFPQLVCVFYIRNTNTYGSVIAFALGAFSRWAIGEPAIALTASVQGPAYDRSWWHQFPYGLACMALSMFALVLVSLLASVAFERRWLSLRYDVFHCFSDARRSSGGRRTDSTLRDKTNNAIVARGTQSVDKGSDGVGGSDERVKADVDGESEHTTSGHRDKAYPGKPVKGTGGAESDGARGRTSSFPRAHVGTPLPRSNLGAACKGSVDDPRK